MLQNIVSVISAFMAAFNIFVFPGFFFYAANIRRHQLSYKKFELYQEVMIDKLEINRPTTMTKEKEIIDAQKGVYWFWTYKYKAYFGIAIAGFGLCMVIALMCIQIYSALLVKNGCLYFEFHPPCRDGRIINSQIF